jgi:hypothetical protein
MRTVLLKLTRYLVFCLMGTQRAEDCSLFKGKASLLAAQKLPVC